MNLKTNTGIAAILLMAWILISAHGCTKNRPSAPSADGYTEHVYTPLYASGFRILGAKGLESTILEVTDPWQGADSVVRRLFISRNGEQAPHDGIMSAITFPARRVVCMSSSHVALLDASGAIDRIVGVSGLDYISNPRIQAGRDTIGDVGFDGNLNYELLLSLRPDIVLIYGVNGASPMENKLNELGIPYMYIGEYLEQSPLGRAEWMIALGEIAGTRKEAEKAFAVIPEEYNRIRDTEWTDTPTVMLNTPYGDSWFMPSTDSYTAALIKDAGGRYVYSGNNSGQSLPVDMETAAILTAQSQIWLTGSQATTIEGLRSSTPKIRFSGMAYNNTADLWESGVACPHIILKDLAAIFHPDSTTGINDTAATLRYYYLLH